MTLVSYPFPLTSPSGTLLICKIIIVRIKITTPDLLINLLNSLPPTALTASFVSSSSISFQNPTTQNIIELQNPCGHGGLANRYHSVMEESTDISSVFHDPILHLNLPAHPPALTELFQSLPSRNDFLLVGGEDDRARIKTGNHWKTK